MKREPLPERNITNETTAETIVEPVTSTLLISEGAPKGALEVLNVSQKIILGNRPQEVQEKAGAAFRKLNEDDHIWGFKGDRGFYGLMNLKALVEENKDIQDIYIMDVGCGSGAWGDAAVHFFLNDKECQDSGKHFHIFSLSGEKSAVNEGVFTKGHVTEYRFNSFKIENIDEELLKEGFDLTGKVNLIVSRWTLRHLVDPWGTLKRVYSLLALQGKLLSNGFLFAFNPCEDYNPNDINLWLPPSLHYLIEGTVAVHQEFGHQLKGDDISSFPQQTWHLLANTNAIALFMEADDNHDVGHLLLVRPDEQELEIPLEYGGKTACLTRDKTHQSYSLCVTLFKQREFEQIERC